MPVNLIPACKKISVNKMPDPFLSFFFLFKFKYIVIYSIALFCPPYTHKKNFLLTCGLKCFFLCWFWLNFCETEVIVISSKIRGALPYMGHPTFLGFLSGTLSPRFFPLTKLLVLSGFEHGLVGS